MLKNIGFIKIFLKILNKSIPDLTYWNLNLIKKKKK